MLLHVSLEYLQRIQNSREVVHPKVGVRVGSGPRAKDARLADTDVCYDRTCDGRGFCIERRLSITCFQPQLQNCKNVDICVD